MCTCCPSANHHNGRQRREGLACKLEPPVVKPSHFLVSRAGEGLPSWLHVGMRTRFGRMFGEVDTRPSPSDVHSWTHSSPLGHFIPATPRFPLSLITFLQGSALLVCIYANARKGCQCSFAAQSLPTWSWLQAVAFFPVPKCTACGY